MQRTAKTLIEKHGFLDPDRKSSKHDEIQLWAYDSALDILKSFSSDSREIEIDYKVLERPISYDARNYHAVVGYVDLYICASVKRVDETKHINVAIEIKSEILSIGDLIRQIQFYRSYQNYDTIWIVVSPDDRYKDILRQQKIYFYKYKALGELF